MKPNRVSVIGAGNVGAGIVNALMLLQVSRDIIFFNRTLQRAEAEAWDIADTIPLIGECQIVPTDSYEDLKDSDIVVITVGAKQSEGQTRIDLLKTNAKIISGIMSELDRVAPEAIIIIVSNPVDIITRIAIDNSKRDSSKIIGSGTILDTSRLRYFLGEKLKVSRKNIHTYIIGEHGDSEFAVWSNAYVSSIKLDNYPLPENIDLNELKEEVLETTKKRAYDIIERKGYTSYGIGVSTAKLIKSILRDERKILSISVKADEAYNLPKGTVLSLPCVIGRDGVEQTLVLELHDREREMLENSANSLNSAYQDINR